MNKNIALKLIGIVLFVVLAVVSSKSVYADCESNYGGGETCVYNKSFKITKQVRLEGNDTWKDKITDVEEGDVIEFKIKIENTGEVDVDDMKMKDELPDELEKVGGSGLTEEWDDFESDETKTFIIKAKVEDDEFDKENFDKCVVNKAEVRYDGEFEGADTATVCYGNGDITELPETGVSTLGLGFTGFGLITVGSLIKRSKRD
ncbi:MAG: hypothetical protein WC243_03570 [Patescibacteria group bacterium]